jgi:hypothetical protein
VWYKFTDVSEECIISLLRIEDGDGKFCQNIGKAIPDFASSHPGRWYSLYF